MVNVLARPTTLQNGLSQGAVSLFRIVNQEEARLANVTIGELLIGLILLKRPIGTVGVFACVQLEA